MKKSILFFILSLMVFFASGQDTTKINGYRTSIPSPICAGSTFVLNASVNTGFLPGDSLIWKQQIIGVPGTVTFLRTVYTVSTMVTIPRDPSNPTVILPAAMGNQYYYTLIVKRGGINLVPFANITINVNPLPPASVTPVGPLTICYGTTVTLNSNTGVGYSYQWQTSSDGGLLVPWTDIPSAITSTYVGGSTSAYRIKITNSNGCVNYSN